MCLQAVAKVYADANPLFPWRHRSRLAQAVDEGFRDAKAMPDPKTATSSHDCLKRSRDARRTTGEVERFAEHFAEPLERRLMPRRHTTLEMRILLRVGEPGGEIIVEEKPELFALCSSFS